jgi:hypothetical protein
MEKNDAAVSLISSGQDYLKSFTILSECVVSFWE